LTNSGYYSVQFIKRYLPITIRTATIELEMPLTKKNEMFKKADINNDDKIDYEEFIKSVEDIKDDRYWSKETTFFRSAFYWSDEDDDGLISIDEFR